ncbi:N-acetyltransferase family protein [Sinomonas atrocyanea]
MNHGALTALQGRRMRQRIRVRPGIDQRSLDGGVPEYAVLMLIREATSDDLAAVEDLCDASDRPRWTAAMIAQSEHRVVFAAVSDDQVVGVAKTHFHPEPDGAAPAGHYLGGVVVTPNSRRLGIGSALTAARLEWIWAQSPSAYYFANEHNTASIQMHEALGFRPRGRFKEIRGVTADDGQAELILFEVSR